MQNPHFASPFFVNDTVYNHKSMLGLLPTSEGDRSATDVM